MFEFVYETLGGGTFWFTSALCVAQIILLLIVLLSIRNVWIIFAICCVLAFIGQSNITSYFTIGGYYFWHWSSALVALFFLSLGGLYCRYENTVDVVFCRWVWIITMILIWIFIIHSFGSILKFAPFNRLLNIEGAIVAGLASFLLVLICKKMAYSQLLNEIGENSLLFYFFSGSMPRVYSIFVSKICPLSSPSLLLVLGLSILTSFYMSRLVKSYFPIVLDLRVLWAKDKFIVYRN